jgi:hypothetical protein
MRLGIRAKLLGSFGVILAMLAIVGVVGYQNTTQFSAEFTELYEDSLLPVIDLAQASEALYELRLGAATFASLDAAGRANVKADEAKWLTMLDASLASFRSHHLTAEQASSLKLLEASSADVVRARMQAISLAEQNNMAESNRIQGEIAGPAFAKSLDVVHALDADIVKNGAAKRQSVLQQAAWSVNLLIGLTLLAIVVGVGIAYSGGYRHSEHHEFACRQVRHVAGRRPARRGRW